MSIAEKSREVQKYVTLLKKKYEVPARRESLSVLETIVYAVLADGATTARADAAFERLKANYFDWNEVRVSALVELQEQLADLPEPELRAARLKGCLRFIFESTYGFDLEQLKKIPMKELAVRFQKMPGVSDYLISRVIRDGLGGTAMPLDSAAVRVLSRLRVIDEKTPCDMLSGSLSRQIPRTRSFEVCHLISELAADVCVEQEPRCKVCCLVDECPTGQTRLAEMAAAEAAKAKRTKTKANGQKPKRDKIVATKASQRTGKTK
jgi:endonuclease-3